MQSALRENGRSVEKIKARIATAEETFNQKKTLLLFSDGHYFIDLVEMWKRLENAVCGMDVRNIQWEG